MYLVPGSIKYAWRTYGSDDQLGGGNWSLVCGQSEFYFDGQHGSHTPFPNCTFLWLKWPNDDDDGQWTITSEKRFNRPTRWPTKRPNMERLAVSFTIYAIYTFSLSLFDFLFFSTFSFCESFYSCSEIGSCGHCHCCWVVKMRSVSTFRSNYADD